MPLPLEEGAGNGAAGGENPAAPLAGRGGGWEARAESGNFDGRLQRRAAEFGESYLLTTIGAIQ